MRSTLAAGDGFGSHLRGLGDILGMGWVPELAKGRQNRPIALGLGRERCFNGIQGSRAWPKCKEDLGLVGPTINHTTA